MPQLRNPRLAPPITSPTGEETNMWLQTLTNPTLDRTPQEQAYWTAIYYEAKLAGMSIAEATAEANGVLDE